MSQYLANDRMTETRTRLRGSVDKQVTLALTGTDFTITGTYGGDEGGLLTINDGPTVWQVHASNVIAVGING